ncbi:epimerase [Clostridium thermosuccinogenes]|uniref:Epimerase n=1 Tax=Clostridium thermosuccinogenes TaxID=84032 RepID=A0A2K2FEQ3_9CLOT|nr:NAD-dependent epimerase/dehydratase family protein [Pseudoclostridium thermosuccinogenes]AUS97804.1 epimerase [Pseudoclostridium thermosuccinogenes]PNT95860.1 epimerase [Pseudoclostridium thermosuccinogenes]PNT97238.1 epimerase [Pseudoclostridium thermosuccinogenes]
MDRFIEQDCLEYIEKIDLTPLRGKTVYITGANGLIGTYVIYMLHLANIIKNAGINIVAVSKSPPGSHLKDIFKDRYTFYSADLIRPDCNCFEEKADYIIHGATYAQPKKFIQNYMETIHLNTTVTERLLKKAKNDGATLLFLSSSEVYGNPDEEHVPTGEDYPGLCSPVDVRAIYSESKRMGETLCFAYRNFEGVNAKIARISMTYGPGIGLKDERVLAHFLRQALYEKKITMLDDGSKIRTFCYIADCVLMLLYIMLYGKDFVYNVGGKDSISIRSLAEEICMLTGSTLSQEIAYKENLQNVKVSPKLVKLDITKVITEFSLPPFKPFREGLIRTIEWNKAVNGLSGF